MALNGAINHFMRRIGTYDKANWEVTVEKQKVKQVLEDNKNVAKLPTDLLDIDLIRGSTFTKAKPGYHWTQVTGSGFLKVFFFPIYYKWWQQQISTVVWLFFVVLYFLQLVSLAIYMSHQNHVDFNNISWPEAIVPLLAIILLGEMYIHVVSTNFTRPIGHKMKKKHRSESSKQSKRNRKKLRNERHRSRNERGRPQYAKHLDKRINDTSVERGSREGSAERFERVLNSNDEERIIKSTESETEADSGYGLRNRFKKTEDGKMSPSSPPESDGPINRNARKISCQQSSGSVEEVSSSDENDSDSASTSSLSDNEVKYITDAETADVLFPNNLGVMNVTYSNALFKMREDNDLINVSIWNGHDSFVKAKLTFFEIGMAVVNQVESHSDNASDYITFACVSALLIGILPLTFRIYAIHLVNTNRTLFQAVSQLGAQLKTLDGMDGIFKQIFGPSWRTQVVVLIAIISRIALSFTMFFLLCVAEGSYKMRYMYAKYFGALTSTRRARRNGLPHFRLHKVKNIKAWLSLRSFLKKRGPQRSVDTIISLSFMLAVLLLVVACVQFLSINGKDEHFLKYFFSWEVSAWSLVLGVFLIRFISLGSDINRKYKNTSVLLTEQINLYLQMEKNVKKKEELLIANNVLKLASKLLKDLEVPFKMSGLIMNPLLSNIFRVVVLSLFSGVMSDILGFRLRLWKIKA